MTQSSVLGVTSYSADETPHGFDHIEIEHNGDISWLEMQQVKNEIWGEDLDPDSQISHISKAIAGLFVVRDAMISNCVIDDRPNTCGLCSEAIGHKSECPKSDT